MNTLDISALPKEFKIISKIANGLKLKAYLVGGPVRDLLMSKRVLDLDIMVEGDTQRLARAVAKKLNAELVSHPRFGTFVLNGKGSISVDFATARQESYPKAGSLPVVKFATVEKDLSRRDFTINAMAFGISGEDKDIIIDYFGGMDDLKKRMLRVLHKKSFLDDPTRIFRLARFHSRGFSVDAETLKLAKKHINGIMNISRERVREELKAVLTEKHAEEALKFLYDLGAMRSVSRSIVIDERISGISGLRTLAEKLCLLFGGSPARAKEILNDLRFERQVKTTVNNLLSGRQKKKVISGRDLIKLGYAPGKQFKKIIDAVESSGIKSYQKAVGFVIDNFPQKR
jgi:tRNA nucleotidyltransferase (CCA-adding enzyme)